MKKILTVAVLALAAATAGAQVTAVSSVETGVVANSAVTVSEVNLGLKAGLGNGFAVQGIVISGHNRGEGVASSDNKGWEVSGLKTFGSIYSLTPTVSVGYGQRIPHGSSVAPFYTVGVEVSKPLTDKASLVAGFKHRNGEFAGDALRSNKTTVGVDYALTKTATIGVAYVHNEAQNFITNGAQVKLNVAF